MKRTAAFSVIKRAISIIAVLAIILSASTPSLAYASRSRATGGSHATGGYGSNGKFLAPIDTPIVGSIAIESRVDLEKIGNDPNYPLDGNYILAADINLSGAAWTPIGNFSGTFDGQGHVIRNMAITGAASKAGLFEKISGIAKNLGMEGTYIDVSLSGYVCQIHAGGIAADGDSFLIANCYAEGSVSGNAAGLDNSAEAFVGGLLGFTSESGEQRITECYNEADIEADSYSAAAVGGIVGKFQGKDGASSIANSRNYGSVAARLTRPASAASIHDTYGGGIAGVGENFSDCVNEGNVEVRSHCGISGGIAGFADTSSHSVFRCSNHGDIKAIADTGEAAFTMTSLAGGVVGCAANNPAPLTEFDCCQNTGDVLALANSTSGSKSAEAGGILAQGDKITFTECTNTGSVKANIEGGIIQAEGAFGELLLQATAGGLGGGIQDAKVLSCGNYGDVEVNFPPNSSEQGFIGHAAGLIGSNSGHPVIKMSTNKGNVTSVFDAGGLADWCETIENSYNAGNVTGRNAGGITKETLYNFSKTTIENVYSSGEVIAANHAGGIAAMMSAGSLEFCSISNSVALSPAIVSSNGTASVIIDAQDIAFNFALPGILGASYGNAGIVSEEEAKTKEFYETQLGWDFAAVWKMPRSQDGYPILMWEYDKSLPPILPLPMFVPGPNTSDSALEPEPTIAATPTATHSPHPTVTATPTAAETPAPTSTSNPQPTTTPPAANDSGPKAAIKPYVSIAQANMPVYELGKKMQAKPTTDKLKFAGKETAVPALKADGYNYLKIRDFAALLHDTDYRFSVNWDPETRMIILSSSLPYNPTKDDLAPLNIDVAEVKASMVELAVNGRIVDLQALNFEGYNCLPMRVLSELLGLEVLWNDGTITILRS